MCAASAAETFSRRTASSVHSYVLTQAPLSCDRNHDLLTRTKYNNCLSPLHFLTEISKVGVVKTTPPQCLLWTS